MQLHILFILGREETGRNAFAREGIGSSFAKHLPPSWTSSTTVTGRSWPYQYRKIPVTRRFPRASFYVQRWLRQIAFVEENGSEERERLILTDVESTIREIHLPFRWLLWSVKIHRFYLINVSCFCFRFMIIMLFLFHGPEFHNNNYHLSFFYISLWWN